MVNQPSNTLGKALQSQVNILRSKGFESTLINIDPQKGLAAIENLFPGIDFNTTGTGDNLPKIDIKIRRIKKICCSIIAGLPWSLPNLGVKDLFTFVISRINTQRTKGLPDNIFPRVKFTGIKIDYKR